MVIIILAPGRVAEEEIDGESDPDDNDHPPGHHLQYHPQENNHLDNDSPRRDDTDSAPCRGAVV